MGNPPLVEIAVQDPAGVRIAFAAGADRVELCQALGVGGLTPSIGTVELAIEASGDAARIAPLVRPRPGGFVYDTDEIDVVTADIRALTSAGVGAVVVGCLTASGDVDIDALRRWGDAAAGAELVFHRAIDAAPAPVRVLEGLRENGVTRVLTSGGAARAVDGLPMLADFVARGGIEIMAGGGVRPEDIPALCAAGVDAVHLSARATSTSTDPSGPGGGAAGFDVTDPDIVRAAVRAARGTTVT